MTQLDARADDPWTPVFDAPVLPVPTGPVVVVAPHPDDETLLAGGLIATLRRRGVPVSVVAVTDGERGQPLGGGRSLGSVRRREQLAACRRLGVDARDVLRLGLPDGDVAAHEDALATMLSAWVDAGTTVVAPWARDHHADHEAVGRAAERAASGGGARLLAAFFWTWHKHGADALAPLSLHRLDLDAASRTARSDALAEHVSQVTDRLSPRLLTNDLLAPMRWHHELYAEIG